MNAESTDLVSVIVPFLNGGGWLLEALESVLHQTYTNWELIIIDDGSDEAHTVVAKNFCSRQPRKIFYAEHAGHINRGVTISRNEAVKYARGSYLAFLDADDVWLPQKLAAQLAIFKKHPETQVVCDTSLIWYSWQNKKAEDYVQCIGAPVNKCYAPRTLTKILYPLHYTSSPAPSGIMIKKEAFKRVQGFEPAFSGIFELYEDQAFVSKLYLTEVVYISGNANVMYRKREDSMSSAIYDKERYCIVRKFYLEWLENFLRKKKIRDKEINFLIEKARKELAPVAEVSAV